MRSQISAVLIVLAFSACVPTITTRAMAQSAGRCCDSCQRPVAKCGCSRPVLQPVVETQYTQRRVVRERDQVATEYRTQPVQETVPTTVMENVTVDEGGYQTVWVPRLTTKPVAKTVYQTRIGYRTVPVQVTRRVQEYGCETVPTQTVRYVPVNGNVVASSPIRYGAPVVSAQPYAPVVAANPGTTGYGLAPDPRFSASTSAYYGYGPAVNPPGVRYDEYQPIGGDGFGSTGVAGGPSLSVPAPSAAAVWRNRGTTVR
ncbi:MAG: hypothetical protein NT069_32655 [Planctomycetota bacterium]|nr:hypothetical protein [Planctomycetota bacterium]